MIRTFLAVLAFSIFTPIESQASWTAEQKEIWEFEEACWETRDLEASQACFHEEYVGWALGALSTPVTKANRKILDGRALETSEQTFIFLKPLQIQVHGNVAVVLYIATGTNKNKATGEETNFTHRWTDIVLKENGKWSWIADHGALIGED